MNDRTTIQIPATIEEAMTKLGGLGKLLTAKGWERAAIVYAFAAPGKAGRPSASRKKSIAIDRLTFREFAEQGIYGLRSQPAVGMHWTCWQEAIDKGWVQAVAPGDEVVLPTQEYPPTATGAPHLISRRMSPSEKVQAVKKLMDQEPEFADALDKDAVTRIGGDAKKFAQASRVHQEHFPSPEKPEPPTHLAGSLTLAEFMLGIHTYVDLKKKDVEQLRAYVRAHKPLSHLDRESVQMGLDALEMTIADIRLYHRVITGEMDGEFTADLARIFAGDQEGASS